MKHALITLLALLTLASCGREEPAVETSAPAAAPMMKEMMRR